MAEAGKNLETAGGILSLESMAHDAQEVYPGVDSEMAILASQDPDQLVDVLKDAAKEELELKQALCAAESAYETELNESGANTTEELRLAATRLGEAEEMLGSIEPGARLADSVRNMQGRLAWPMRAAATVLATLAVGIGSGFYVAESHPDNYGSATTKEAKNFKEIYTKSPVGIGILFGLMGGVGGNVVGAFMTPYEARRRARKIIQKESPSK